jgi:hypothetical protein
MIPRTEALDFGHDRELFDVADVLIAASTPLAISANFLEASCEGARVAEQ